MSINAIVSAVSIDGFGKGYLQLEGEERGQSKLFFDFPPRGISKLKGRQVWGSSCSLMLGDKVIARREGFERIVFVVDEL